MILRRRVIFLITCECLLFPFILLRRVGAKHNSKNCLSIGRSRTAIRYFAGLITTTTVKDILKKSTETVLGASM